jgi:light-regulated signal transduction histidine kinase (bacteriophytochrome)
MTGATDLPSWHGQAYSTKRHGTSFAHCDSEPVQTPGCVQAHGALIVLRPETLVISQASENTLALLGHDASALLGQSVGVVVGAQGEERLRNFLAVEPVECNPLYVLSVPGADGRLFDVTVHSNGGVLLLEFEATLRPAQGTAESGQSAEPDYYALMRKSVVRMQGARTLREFCDITVDELRAMTGFDRVMVYKFHADGHGEVFAESRLDTLAPWLGLHYPAADIPQPAREVFKQIWLRPTPDVGGALAEMVPLADPVSNKPLVMTHCALRGASVMYTEYLQNMKVTAGLTLSIRQDGELWGLIACHHYAGPKFVSYPVRTACEFLAQVASLQRRSAETREQLESRLRLEEVHRQLLAAASHVGELADLFEGEFTLADAVPCGGVALFHAGRWWRLGETPSDVDLDALAAWVAMRPEFLAATSPIYATDHLAADYPDGVAPASVASGLLAVPLSRTKRSLMFWFRPETLRTIRWAGHPDDKPSVPGPNGSRLTPRASFDLFQESVRGRSAPWLMFELDAIARLRVAVLELVVERSEQLAVLNADLLRSNEDLDAFAYVASHDLKEPLRGIHKYAHQLQVRTDSTDAEAQRQLGGLMRLTLRMDSLLDSLLHFSRVGRVLLELSQSDLNLVVADAIEMVGSRLDASKPEFVLPRPLPGIECDWVRCREIYVNLLSNALKYSDRADKRIEIGWIGAGELHARPLCPPDALGQPIFYVRDNGIGIAARHYEQVFKMFRRLHTRDTYGGGSGAGLAIVKKLVERHRGRIWIDSEPGVGSTFYFTLSADARPE